MCFINPPQTCCLPFRHFPPLFVSYLTSSVFTCPVPLSTPCIVEYLQPTAPGHQKRHRNAATRQPHRPKRRFHPFPALPSSLSPLSARYGYVWGNPAGIGTPKATKPIRHPFSQHAHPIRTGAPPVLSAASRALSLTDIPPSVSDTKTLIEKTAVSWPRPELGPRQLVLGVNRRSDGSAARNKLEREKINRFSDKRDTAVVTQPKLATPTTTRTLRRWASPTTRTSTATGSTAARAARPIWRTMTTS